MHSIIEELYKHFCPSAILADGNPDYTDATRLRDKNRDKLLALLGERETEMFERYCIRQCEVDDIVRLDRFAYGLRLGVMLMTEVFRDA